MNRCGLCSKQAPDGCHECPACGGTLVPEGLSGPPAPLLQPGVRLLSRFRVEKLLGHGATGAVYGVTDHLLNRRAALKVFWNTVSPEDPEFERLRREVNTSQGIQDPRVVSIFELLFVGTRPALLMEWVEGTDLKEHLKREGPLAEKEALRIISEVLGALSLFHDKGIVHRDVKSGNILLDREGRVKLGDLGLAKAGEGSAILTTVGTALGTPGYMAPEVIRGGEATPRSDLYGAGVVLFELLAGRLPFAGTSALEVASRHLTAPPPLRLLKEHHTSARVRRVVGRMLAKDPADRYPSVQAAVRDLQTGKGLWVSRRSRRWGAVVALALAAAAGSAWWLLAAIPTQVRFSQNTLHVYDRFGRTLWSKTEPEKIQSACIGRFGPEGSWAVACALQWPEETSKAVDPASRGNPLVIYDKRGTPVDRWVFQYLGSPFDQHWDITLQAHRFAKGQTDRLVVAARHVLWYPFVLSILDPVASSYTHLSSHAVTTRIYNSGVLSSWGFADVNGDGCDDVIFAGVNNRLFRLNIMGVALVPPESRDQGLASADRALERDDLFMYRLLPSSPSLDPTVDTRTSPPLIRLPTGTQWRLGVGGKLLAPDLKPVAPSAEVAQRINGFLPAMVAMDDQGDFQGLLDACGKWPKPLSGPYAWLNGLFRAKALMGLGRYDEALSGLDAVAAREPSPVPPWRYRAQLDALFLAGRYHDCLAKFRAVPMVARGWMPEIPHTAALAALYAEDTNATEGMFRSLDEGNYGFLTPVYRAAGLYFSDHPKTALDILDHAETNRNYLGVAQYGLWRTACLIDEGHLGEAREFFDHLVAEHAGEKLEEDEVGLWLNWKERPGDRRTLASLDAMVARQRLAARTDPDIRAFLPLTLGRDAAAHGNMGDRATSDRLLAEACRLAPSAWRDYLRHLAAL